MDRHLLDGSSAEPRQRFYGSIGSDTSGVDSISRSPADPDTDNGIAILIIGLCTLDYKEYNELNICVFHYFANDYAGMLIVQFLSIAVYCAQDAYI